ncbi:CHAT domain-containing protein [Corynascus novoguineensis]|uniref:CHAT domain-containing protein n=1 Tax=Corynascus novoguineensis TaxID=1126955 RepID=A0AAN7CRN4_9PEZI|nr:CHAT domain-containing protein [Corynascus novoguineensis]
MSTPTDSSISSMDSRPGSATGLVSYESVLKLLETYHLMERELNTAEVDLETAQSLESLRQDISDLERFLEENQIEEHNEFAEASYWNDRSIADVLQGTEDAKTLYMTTSTDDPSWPTRAHNYAMLLRERFFRSLAAVTDELIQLTGELADLDRAIRIFEKLTKPESLREQRARWLSNLASSLQRRFEQNDAKYPGDLIRAIEVSQEAVNCTIDDDPSRWSILSAAAQPLASLAEIENDVERMNLALDFLHGALEAAPKEHLGRLEIETNLALRTFQKYKILNSAASAGNNDAVEYLEDAIQTATSALTFADKAHAHHHHLRDHLHNMLGLFYFNAFLHSGSSSREDATKAMSHLQNALHSATYTPVYRRVQAGRLVLRLCCAIRDWETAYSAAVVAVDLIPKITPRSLRTADKQRLLSAEDVVGFGADAAAAALNANKSAYEALSILERSRGSLPASIMELRVDLDALKDQHPVYAYEFISVRNQLEMNTSSIQRYEANNRFDELVDEIREQPGFERFLQPPNDEDIREAAQRGPLVVLSASHHRGVDAFLITQGNGVEVLSLTEVSVEELEKRSDDLASLEALEWLWTSIVEPVLNSLGYTKSLEPGEDFPRIWWIPTGILTRFPFHAAGRHAADSRQTAMDRVMSSYSTSIRALLSTRRRTHSPQRPRQVLLVAMANTPKHAPLALPLEEVRTVEELFASSGSFNCISLRDIPQKKLVLQHLESCQIFHFAGHGKENATDPSQSLLLLHDWQDDPLTVDSLFGLNISNRFLAYLSACETGQVTKAKFRDEGIHLCGAHQLAGFRHVIGTLWSVADSVCVKMAAATYKVLLKEFDERDLPMTDELVCRALHTAIKEQRDKAVSGLGR